MNPLALYIARAGLNHDTGPGHPERPDRLRALIDLFSEAPFDTLPCIDAAAAELSWIRRAHPAHYIESIENAIPDRGLADLGNDIVLSPGSMDAALEAAGAVCMAVEAVAAGQCRRAFCAVRPPGHHAEPSKAMGFCLFNNVFIGARHAQEACGLRRVAIVDFDVHHGNGTEDMTRLAAGIFYISSHQYPFYPMTGHPQDNAPNRILNLPLAAGSGSADFRAAYKDQALPALDTFEPDLILLSAGFDAHRDDPLGETNVSEDDFAWLTTEIARIAERRCSGRIVSVLEGGYDLDALKSSAAAHLEALLNY